MALKEKQVAVVPITVATLRLYGTPAPLERVNFELPAYTVNENGGSQIVRVQRVGAATKGAALLAGLLRCRRCGRRLMVWYTGATHDVLRYACHRGALDNGDPRCISFGGLVVDAAMAKEVLRVVQPAAIDAAVVANEDASRQQDDVLQAWTRELEAARYAA